MRILRNPPASVLVPLLLLVAALGTDGCCACRHAPESGAVRTRWVTGPFGKIRVEDGGSGGTPVVFVHGLGGSLEVWRAQLDHLRPGRRAVALDLHGMGRSEPSAEGIYTVPSFADDVRAVPPPWAWSGSSSWATAWAAWFWRITRGATPARWRGFSWTTPRAT